MLSNKYGSLGTDTNTGEPSEELIAGEGDKENQEVNIQNAKGKGTLQEKKSLVFGSNGGINLNGGNKEGGNGNKKIMEGVKGRPKKSTNRPVRGLVFGPTKGETNLSTSGKRLRVENSDAGRPGGVFRDSVEVRVMPKLLQLRDEGLENPMEIIRSETEKQMVEELTTVQVEEVVGSLA